MGIEYSIIDRGRKDAIDIHKSYWLAGPVSDHTAITAQDVQRCAPDCPEAWAWMPATILAWMAERPGPFELVNDHTGNEPWDMDEGGSEPGWTVYTPWDNAVAGRRTTWGGNTYQQVAIARVQP